MIPVFIRLLNARFRLADISHYKFRRTSPYVGNPPIITIFKPHIQDGYEVIYHTSDGNKQPDIEAYERDKNMLDELLLGKTPEQDKLLP